MKFNFPVATHGHVASVKDIPASTTPNSFRVASLPHGAAQAFHEPAHGRVATPPPTAATAPGAHVGRLPGLPQAAGPAPLPPPAAPLPLLPRR
jgi:hypothetical protein